MLFLQGPVARRQTNRILCLTFPRRLHAVEALSRDVECKVELLSDDASLAMEGLMAG